MKSINLKLGIVSLGLLLNVSCKKEQTSIQVNQQTSTTNIEVNSKKFFGESDPIYDNLQNNERDYLNYDFNSLKKENDYFIFTDYTAFFKALKKTNSLSESEYNEAAKSCNFNCKKADYSSFSSRFTSPTNEVLTIPFQGYFRLLNKDGVVKIGNELHLYRNKSLVIIKNGNNQLIENALSLSDNSLDNKTFSVFKITTLYYNVDYTNSTVAGTSDGNHVSSLASQGSAVLVTSPLPGIADAYNYDFHIDAVSMAPINVANFPCDMAFSYFRCILKYINYQGTLLSINSTPYTQGGLYHTASAPPTTWSISGNVGQALIPVGATFTGSYCSQVGYWEKYSTPGYIGTGGAYQLKCSFNSCKPF